MKKESENRTIGCLVDSCRFHSKTNNCCSLNNIEVGCCANQPKNIESTCCNSFQAKPVF
ncbi:MAG: DUF1540 domain-containing protein [Acutalibacteraceae bacterium]